MDSANKTNRSDRDWRLQFIAVVLAFLFPIPWDSYLEAASPSPVSNISVEDVPNDDGTALQVTWTLSPDDSDQSSNRVVKYEVLSEARLQEHTLDWSNILSRILSGQSPYVTRAATVISVTDAPAGSNRVVLTGLSPSAVSYGIRVRSLGHDDVSFAASDEPLAQTRYADLEMVIGHPRRNWFNWNKLAFACITCAVCGAVIVFTELARRGKPFYVRPIAGLQAIEEAVGRATEMGKPMLFVPGIQDMNEIDTVAGLTILSSVAKTAAEYDTSLEVPTTRSLVMTAAREAVQAAALSAGRPDYYSEDRIYYVTDEQFGYVAYTCGWMNREQPAACFFLGKFYAESLILAETGNSVGAIQIAGTAETTQLPFFVAACDYTLLGEELFAASAYLSNEPSQLGMLKGQDVGKLGAMLLIILGCLLATWDTINPRGVDSQGKPFPSRASFISESILNSP